MNDESPSSGFVDNHLAFLLAKASHVVSGGFHAQLKRLGISIGTWRILAVLRDGPATVGDLADRVLLNQPTMSKTLDRLEAEGLLRRERERDPLRRRNVRVELAPAGRSLIETLVPMAQRHEAQAFAHLAPEDRQRLAGMLRSTIARNAGAGT